VCGRCPHPPDVHTLVLVAREAEIVATARRPGPRRCATSGRQSPRLPSPVTADTPSLSRSGAGRAPVSSVTGQVSPRPCGARASPVVRAPRPCATRRPAVPHCAHGIGDGREPTQHRLEALHLAQARRLRASNAGRARAQYHLDHLPMGRNRRRSSLHVDEVDDPPQATQQRGGEPAELPPHRSERAQEQTASPSRGAASGLGHAFGGVDDRQHAVPDRMQAQPEHCHDREHREAE